MSEDRVAPPRFRAWLPFHSAVHFLWREQVAPVARAAAFLRRVVGLGLAETASVLLVCVAAMLAALSFAPAVPPGAQAMLRAASHLSLFVVVWSASLAAAAAQPSPWLLLAVAPWLAFYQLLSLNVWVGTPIVVAPTLVVLVAVHRSLHAWSSRVGAAVIWPGVAAAFAYAAAVASGLRRLLGWTSTETQLVVALTVTVLGWTVMALFSSRASESQRYRRVFVAAVFVFGGAMALAAYRALPVTVDWTQAMAGDFAAIVVLLWMWLGGRAGAGALHAAEWMGRQTVRLVPPTGRIAAIVIVVVGVSAIELMQWLRPSGEFGALTRAPHAVLGASIVTWLLWQWARGRREVRLATDAAVWWAVAWLLLEGASRAVQTVVTSRSGLAFSTMAVVVLAAGLVLEVGALERSWATMPDARVRRQLGLLGASLGCAVLLSTTADVNWAGTRSLMLLTGLLHLALPVAIATRWQQRRGETPLPNITRVALFASGYAGGLIVLLIDPRRDVCLLALVPALVAALAIVRWRAAALGPAAGTLAGLLFAAGAVAAWMMPYPPTIPFSTLRPWSDVLTHWGQIGRPLMTARHLGVLAVAWIIGGACGAAIFSHAGQRPPSAMVPR